MKIIPRPYQIRVLNELWTALQVKQNILFVACCSAGKTIVFSKLIQRLIREQPHRRVMIMADREILVSQAVDKLLTVAPELAPFTGICCAAMGQTDTHKTVTICSRQSIINRVDKIQPVDLLIFDEVHLTAPQIDGKPLDQFGKIYMALRDRSPNMRFIGCTATPYRLGTGYIYPPLIREDATSYFDQVDSVVTIKELLANNPPHLSSVKGLIAESEEMKADLSKVGKVAGEFNLGQLEEVSLKEFHLNSVVEAYQDFSNNEDFGKRECCLIFCTTIKHCEAVADLIPGCVPIHSKNKNTIEGNSAKCYTSVAKLTTGLDRTDVDLIVVARGTASPALHVQMIGRGARLHVGKKDCLVVDLVGNCNIHGLDLDNPVVKVPNIPGGGEFPSKVCPGEIEDFACGAVLHAAVRKCPECGFEFTTESIEALLPDLKKVVFNEELPPEIVNVQFMDIYETVSKTSEKSMLVAEFSSDDFGAKNTRLYMMFEGDGYSGYPVKKTQKFWEQLTCDPFPETAKEAIESEFEIPKSIMVKTDGKFKNISALIYGEADIVNMKDSDYDAYCKYKPASCGDDVPLYMDDVPAQKDWDDMTEQEKKDSVPF